MFDVTSISENLHCNQKFGCIEGLRGLEAMAGQGVLQTKPRSLCFMVYIKSGGNN
jgi:hypothetical protein